MTQVTGQPGGLLVATPAAVRAGAPSRLSDLAQLTKPRITLMVAMTTWLGYVMGRAAIEGAGGAALASAVSVNWLTLAATLMGAALSCMGASALNQALERDSDALMQRTKDRPVPAGRVTALQAAMLGVLLATAGVTILLSLSSPLGAALAAFTVGSYALCYTPLKRISSVSTIVGAVPGALPPVIGYAGATGQIGPAALAMFAIMFMWQLPHFLAIAWLYRDDYARAGMPMLPVVDPTGGSTFRQILLGCLALLPLGLVPTLIGVSGLGAFIAAFVAGLVFLAFGVAVALRPTRASARRMFYASLVYLPIVLAAMVLDRL